MLTPLRQALTPLTLPAAAAAFSPLGMAGPPTVWIDFKRGSFFSDLGVTPCNSGDLIDQANDLSAAGNHVTATGAGAANRLAFIANGRNGNPVGRATQAAQLLNRATFTGGAVAAPFSLVFVGSHSAINASGGYMGDAGSGAGRMALHTGSGGDSRLFSGASDAVVQTNIWNAPLPWHLVVAVFGANGVAKYRRNGVLVNNNLTPGTNSVTGVTCFNVNPAAASGFAGGGDKGVLLFFPGDVTADPDLVNLEKFLWADWGTPQFATWVDTSFGQGHEGTPSSCVLADGRTVLTAFRDGTADASFNGKIYTVTALDGQAPSAPSLVLSGGNDHRVNVGLTRLPNGNILLPGFDENASAVPVLAWTLLSTDGGLTWSAARTVAVPAGYTWLVPYGRILNPSGDSTNLLMPAYAKNTASGFTDALMMQSADGGTTWTKKGVVASNGTQNWDETAAAFVIGSTTSMYAFVRNSSAGPAVYLTGSADAGATWAAPALATFLLSGGSGVSPDTGVNAAGTAYYLWTGYRGISIHGIQQCKATAAPGTVASWTTGQYVWIEATAGAGGLGYPSAVQLTAGPMAGWFVANFHDNPAGSAANLQAVLYQESELR